MRHLSHFTKVCSVFRVGEELTTEQVLARLKDKYKNPPTTQQIAHILKSSATFVLTGTKRTRRYKEIGQRSFVATIWKRVD